MVQTLDHEFAIAAPGLSLRPIRKPAASLAASFETAADIGAPTSNGTTKLRGTQDITLRPMESFRILGISTGDLDVFFNSCRPNARRVAGRQFRCALAVMQTKLEGWRAVISLCR